MIITEEQIKAKINELRLVIEQYEFIGMYDLAEEERVQMKALQKIISVKYKED